MQCSRSDVPEDCLKRDALKVLSTIKDAFLPDDPQLAKLRFEQLRMAAKNMAPATYTLPAMGIVMAFLFSTWSDDASVFLWLGSVFASVWYMGREASLTVGADEDEPGSLRRWTLRLVLAYGLVTVCWSLMGVWFWVPGDHLNHILMLLFMCASVAATAALTAPSPAVCTVAMGWYALIFGMLPSSETDPLYNWLIVLALGYTTFMAGVARSVYKATADALALQEDKNELIDQLQRAKNESDGARLRAEAASRAKSDFLANMSHELRTPLNAILGFSEVMKDELLGPIGSATYKGYAADIHTSGAHLLKLINDVLDLSRIEAGRHTLSNSELNLSEIASDVMTFFALSAQQGGITLTVDVPEGLGLVGDERGIKQVLINLVANAVKFTPNGGSITISAAVNERACISISVRDTGCGIDQQQVLHVFETFGQGRHDIAARDKGTGLGLPIVKGIIEAHGGTVRLDSKVGEGTMFTATFPAVRTVSRVAPVAAKSSAA